MTINQDKSSKPSDPTMNPSSQYFLHPTNIGLNLVSTVFSGVGFKSWKRAISNGLSGKNKMGFVDGTIKRSTTSSAHERAWDKVNDVVLVWLLNVVDERINQSVLWFKTTKEVCEMPTVCEAYRILTQEQTHQEISRTSYVDTQETTIACRTEKRKFVQNKSKNIRNKKTNNQFFCEHCKIHGHNIERCWKIHGYPPN